MDRKGLLILITATILMVSWQIFVAPRIMPPPSRSARKTTAEPSHPGKELVTHKAPAKAKTRPAIKQAKTTTVSGKAEAKRPSPAPPQYVEIHNDLMKVEICTLGGYIRRVFLQKYTDEEGNPLLLVDTKGTALSPQHVRFALKLAEKLVKKAPPYAAMVAERLEPAKMKYLQSLVEHPSRKAPSRAAELLAEELNRLILSDRLIADAGTLERLDNSGKLLWMVRHAVSAADTAEVNRLILSAMFPRHIASPPYPMLLDIVDTKGGIAGALEDYRVVERTNDTVTLEADMQGLSIRKTFKLDPSGYGITFTVSITNTSSAPSKAAIVVHGPSFVTREDLKQNYLGAMVHYIKNSKVVMSRCYYNKTFRMPSSGEIVTPPQTYDLDMEYVAVCNRFFAFAAVASPPLRVSSLGVYTLKNDLVIAKKGKKTGTMASWFATNAVKLEPGKTGKIDLVVYAGPRQTKHLKKYPPITDILDYGRFGFISRAMLVVLKGVYSVTGNYGIAIIVLTILIRLLMFPLSRKMALSQHKQQKLAPRIKELQQKYKNNKNKLNQEMLKLYREEGVNPLGGCLPMLLQIPFFIGMLRLLQYSIELRHATFIPGWIDDLSRPDTVATIPSWFPIGAGFPVNILPILMGIATIVQQHVTPKPADPQAQQQMAIFRLIPLIFVFILYNWPSGLILYWTVSTTIGIAEQVIIRRILEAHE